MGAKKSIVFLLENPLKTDVHILVLFWRIIDSGEIDG